MKVKIGLKLTVIMVVLSLVGIGAVSIILLNRARTNIEDLAIKYTLSLSEKGADEVKAHLEGYWHTVETIAEMMEQYDSMTLSNRRNFLNIILRGLTEEHPEVIGMWCVWEPNALEGNDQRIPGNPGNQRRGAFCSLFFMGKRKAHAPNAG